MVLTTGQTEPQEDFEKPEGTEEEGWSTGQKVAVGVGAAVATAAVVGGATYAYKKHNEDDEEEQSGVNGNGENAENEGMLYLPSKLTVRGLVQRSKGCCRRCWPRRCCCCRWWYCLRRPQGQRGR